MQARSLVSATGHRALPERYASSASPHVSSHSASVSNSRSIHSIAVHRSEKLQLQLCLLQLVQGRLHPTTRVGLHGAQLQENQEAQNRDAAKEHRDHRQKRDHASTLESRASERKRRVMPIRH